MGIGKETVGDEMRRMKFHQKYTVSPNGCWDWLAYKNDDGYGRLKINNRIELAHRHSFRIHRGPIPIGMQVLHKCDNPGCINPDHLFLGTQIDNINDMVAKGRARAPKGIIHHKAKLNPEKVFEIRWLSASGGHSKYKLARMYGVTKANIQFVVKNKTWVQECHD